MRQGNGHSTLIELQGKAVAVQPEDIDNACPDEISTLLSAHMHEGSNVPACVHLC